MYESTEELLREIEAGEDSFLDLKEVRLQGAEIRFAHGRGRASQELAKDLSCFANTEGGVIVFGVRDDGERMGLPEDRMAHLQEFILNVAQHNVEPPLGHLLLFNRLQLPDRAGTLRLCLKVDIKKALYSVHAPLGDRPYHRLADRCHPMTLEQQARVFERRGMMIPFEERPVFAAPPDAMDLQRFHRYHERKYGWPLADSEVPIESLLQNLKLAAVDEGGALHPTALGLLLFSPRPDRYLTGAFVDVVVYDGDQPDAACQRDAKTFTGTVVEQIERVMEYLRLSPFLPVPATKDELGRIDRPAYSLRAVQEAVVNALVHRDYAIQGAQVRIFLFLNRIEIMNPGRLHNTLTPEALYAGCQPIRRNQMLAGFLREYNSPITGRAYMEGRGEGFLVMVRECIQISGRRPEVELVGDAVRLTIHAHPTGEGGSRSEGLPAH